MMEGGCNHPPPRPLYVRGLRRVRKINHWKGPDEPSYATSCLLEICRWYGYVLPICFWGQLQPAAQADVRVEKTSVFGWQLRQSSDLTKDVAVFK